MSLRGGGKSAAEMQEEWLGNMTLHFSCAFCSWKFDGGLVEGRSAANTHRAQEHPEIPPYRRPRRRSTMRSVSKAELSDEEREEVEADRRRRAIQLGIAIQE